MSKLIEYSYHGLHGFLGSNLVADLKKRNNIYGLDFVSPSKDGMLRVYTWPYFEDLPVIVMVCQLSRESALNEE